MFVKKLRGCVPSTKIYFPRIDLSMSRSSKILSHLHSIATYSFTLKGAGINVLYDFHPIGVTTRRVARKKIGYRGCSRRWSQLPEKLGAGVFLVQAASDKH
jgi:hypothetical protein